MYTCVQCPPLRRIVNPYPKNNTQSDAGAEAAQRQALALRCREWEGDDGGVLAGERPGADAGPGAGSDSGLLGPSSAVIAAKRAAVPCLRNLASFVSNQGRHVDAEVVLVSWGSVDTIKYLFEC